MGVEMQIASVALGLLAAKQSKEAYRMEADAYREQANMATMQADQQEAERNQQLRRQLASLGVSMSAQGVALGTSASVSALRNDEVKMAKKDISNIKLMGMSNRRKYEISAASSEAAGKAATLGGFAKTATGVYSINKGVA